MDQRQQGDIQAIKEAMGEIQAEALVAQNAKESELSRVLQAVIHEINPRAQRAKNMLQARFGAMRESTWDGQGARMSVLRNGPF